jgi:hypothetical protein
MISMLKYVLWFIYYDVYYIGNIDMKWMGVCMNQ